MLLKLYFLNVEKLNKAPQLNSMFHKLQFSHHRVSSLKQIQSFLSVILSNDVKLFKVYFH